MKIYVISSFYGQTTEKRIYDNEKEAKDVALRLAKNTSAKEVRVDELEPCDAFNGRFLQTRACGIYNKTSK